VSISIAFARGKIASAFEHPAIGCRELRKIRFGFLDFARKRTAGAIAANFTFHTAFNDSLDFHITFSRVG
jgi:hypothetical protein